jgi:lipoprotein-anchoring transpeptidase ErfK/SrfK
MKKRRTFCLIAAAAMLGTLPCPAADRATVDEKALRLQVWLDRENFGPGKIDAKGGEFTKKALALYKTAHAEAPLKDDAPADFQEPVVTEYQVREQDFTHVGDLPREKEEQSKLKKMPYPSIEDFVAERYHSDPELLKRLNPGADLSGLKAGDTVKAPNVVPFEIEALHSEKKPVAPSEAGGRSVVIDTHELFLRVMENDKVIAAFPITAGSERLPAPVGSWKVETVTPLPEFRWDLEMLNKGQRGSNAIDLPPGPRNPVGVFWIGLNKKGVGVHGTDSPLTIGRSVSHGCVRLSNWDAAKVAAMIKPGVAVEIR